MARFLYFPWNKETIYVPVPSLEQIAAVKVAITLWNRTDIRALMDKCEEDYLISVSKSHFPDQPLLVEIEAEIISYARELPLSEKAKDKVLRVVKPIGMQIFLWKNRFTCDEQLPKQLFWNVSGAIDPKRTAKGFVNDFSISLELRYETACAYCLEDDVINLWEQLSEESREAFTSNSDPDDDIYLDRLFQDDLVKLWSRAMKQEGDLKNRFDSLDISSDYWFLVFAVRDCLQPAAEYFLPKLTRSAKRNFFVDAQWEIFQWTHITFNIFGHETYFWFLLQMEEDQQIAAITKNAIWVLMWCLDWPWQDLFLPAANRLRLFLSCSEFYGMLSNINSKTKQGYRDYDYQHLFAKVWELCPETAKRHAIKQSATKCDLLTELFSVGDKINVQLILKDATDEELENIISCNREFCLVTQHGIPQDENSKNVAKMRWMCLFLLEFVVDEEFNRRKIEGNPSKKFRAAGDCDYQHIFTKFWELLPETAQRSIMRELASNCDLLTDLLSVGDKRNVQLILKDATDDELKSIISWYRKNCMASQNDQPKDGFSDNYVEMRWMGLLLLEFLVDEEFKKRKIKDNLC